jgi:hypothetical protein
MTQTAFFPKFTKSFFPSWGDDFRAAPLLASPLLRVESTFDFAGLLRLEKAEGFFVFPGRASTTTFRRHCTGDQRCLMKIPRQGSRAGTF